MDKSTVGGLLVATGGILLGLLFEGGKVSQIIQPTAGLIVLGGTLGAVMVQFPLDLIKQATLRLRDVFVEDEVNPYQIVSELVLHAQKARKSGIVSLDSDLANVRESFMRRALMFGIDGTHPEDLRMLLEDELERISENVEQVPRVYEAAGGFAPTIGIIGAILGLIQVMQHLQNIDEVGKGIAVAFVATIYGVGAANLFFLPAAGKLKIRIRRERLLREVIIEGVISILEGVNPRMLEAKLHGLLQGPESKGRAGIIARSNATESAAV